ncbi:MAG: right-handed parallel beta-helix repeat-containing protein [Deltaproteobacteria bacterium]|nr:MAG: right-handed parallel beta-helix repeat-containing protein [Deltaproteobacteria bacterium]
MIDRFLLRFALFAFLSLTGCDGDSVSSTFTDTDTDTCVIYVDPSGDDHGSGLSWADAKATLYAGLGAAVDESCSEVWVTASIFYPSAEHEATYALSEGLALRGGFEGGETHPDQRASGSYTTLSSPIDGDPSERSERIVTAADGVLLDGVHIRDGAGRTDMGRGSALFVSEVSVTVINSRFSNNGAGSVLIDRGQATFRDVMFVENLDSAVVVADSTATFRDVTFLNNGFGEGLEDTAYGAGIQAAGDSVVTVRDCLFTGNRAAFGGALRISGDAKLIVTDSTFERNRASEGGAVYVGPGATVEDGLRADLLRNTFRDNQGYFALFGSGMGGGMVVDRAVHVRMSATTFERNWAGFEGHALFVQGDFGSLKIQNSVFLQNVSPHGGGIEVDLQNSEAVHIDHSWFGVEPESSGSSDILMRTRSTKGYVHITNSILWNQEATTFHGASEDLWIERSIVRGGCPGEPGVVCGDGVLDVSPEMCVGTPCAGSPLIDAGRTSIGTSDWFDLNDNGDTEEPLPFDMLGRDRVIGDAPDIGPFERL